MQAERQLERTSMHVTSDPFLHTFAQRVIRQLCDEPVQDAWKRGGARHLRGHATGVAADVTRRQREVVPLTRERDPLASDVGERDGEVGGVRQTDERDVRAGLVRSVRRPREDLCNESCQAYSGDDWFVVVLDCKDDAGTDPVRVPVHESHVEFLLSELGTQFLRPIVATDRNREEHVEVPALHKLPHTIIEIRHAFS